MIDTRNTQKLVAAAGAVLWGERCTSGERAQRDERASEWAKERAGARRRHHEVFSIFGMYRDPRRQAAGA